MGNTLKSLFRRRKSESIEIMREEFRKLGLVLTGGGIVAGVLNSNWYGIVTFGMGLVFYYYGLTEPKEDNDGN